MHLGLRSFVLFALHCHVIFRISFIKINKKISLSSASVFLTISFIETFIRYYWPTKEVSTSTFGYETNFPKILDNPWFWLPTIRRNLFFQENF